MTIILFIFILFILLLMFASSLILSVLRWILSLFGIGGSRAANDSYYGAGGSRGGNAGRTSSSSSRNSSGASDTEWHYSPEAEYKRRKRKKIIGNDEGEYVDYEEMKE
ncbi:MAG: DUF4834 family protein [Bacteroidaceae bacterium]|nr:DUF4834 family protein [Bacteroidaceae bacterium]